ncbi:hypothetical protein GJV07_00675 [Enterobacteriaceae bacterium RIT711]|nr:hypothetical protein [Enterobacteriaceae bacterium RIT711]
MSESEEQKIFEEFNRQASEHAAKFKKETFRRLQKVTPELFAQFLSDKGVSRRCLACGHSELSTSETMSLDSSLSPFGSRPISELTLEETEEYMKATAVHYVTPSVIDNDKRSLVSNYQYQLICANCGYTSLFRAANVVYWVEALNVNLEGK